ncbi:hypothetical protein RJ55_01102 [Drechmeria coniospora]|nr:hypothetical protein RJ55_01102 [Drechmeria coniospora]
MTDLNTTSTDSAASANEPVYVLPVVLGSILLILVLSFFICWYGTKRLDASHRNARTTDVEAAQSRFSPSRLDEVAESQTYKQWKEKTEQASKTTYSSYLVCVICIETLQDQDLVRRLPCDHIFHAECLLRWFTKRHDSCPLCKVAFLSEETADDAANTT